MFVIVSFFPLMHVHIRTRKIWLMHWSVHEYITLSAIEVLLKEI